MDAGWTKQTCLHPTHDTYSLCINGADKIYSVYMALGVGCGLLASFQTFSKVVPPHVGWDKPSSGPIWWYRK